MLTAFVHQQNCKKNKIITDLETGEIACSNCDVVSHEKPVEFGPGNFGLTKEEYIKTSRAGKKISLRIADMGVLTIIESQDKDTTGKYLSKENRRIFYRLHMWDRNSRSPNTVKSFQKAFLLLDGIRAKLNLPESVVKHTTYLFRKISAKKILNGRTTTGILCSTVYISCRVTNTLKTLQDVEDAESVKRKNLQGIYRFLIKELNIYPEAYNPYEFIARISKTINVTEKTERLAFNIVSLAEKNGMSASKNPMAMAVSVFHLATLKNNEKVSRLKISEVSGINAVTIRDRTKEKKKRLGGEIYG